MNTVVHDQYESRKLTLSFRSPELEGRFQQFHTSRSLNDFRRAALIAATLIVLFGLFDKSLFPLEYRHLWIIRYGVMAPVTLGVWLLCRNERLTYLAPVGMSIAVYTVAVCMTLMSVLVTPPEAFYSFSSLCLAITFAYTLSRVRFIQSVITSVALTITYIVILLLTKVFPIAVTVRNAALLLTFNVVGGSASYMIEHFTRKNFIQGLELRAKNIEIQKQQSLAESLLLNVLPSEVAAELKEKGAVDPRYHEDVTILFTDFKGFTLATEQLPAEELVRALHEYFTAFDTTIQQYGLEKLKTIGDSYMAVAGLPERRASHAVDAVLAAFDIVDKVMKAHGVGLPRWSVRIGVHTGPVISGVVGIRKFAYDIWGESVNFASRMESSGAPNRVNLSASTYMRVKDFFECEYRGKVPTKEGREFDMYFAVSALAGLRQSGDAESAFRARYKTYFQRELPSLPPGL
jgi:class 3 adenylate cyclase